MDEASPPLHYMPNIYGFISRSISLLTNKAKRKCILSLFINFSLTLQIVHKIINYNMTIDAKGKKMQKRLQRVTIQNTKKR